MTHYSPPRNPYQIIPCGEYTLKLMGKLLIPLFSPVTRSVSSSISFIMERKSMNFFPLQCKNSPYSVGPLISCRISGLLVTIPDPRGRKSLDWFEINIWLLVLVLAFKLTFQRNFPALMIFPQIGHPLQLFVEGQCCWTPRAGWRHPASCSWWGWAAPSRSCPPTLSGCICFSCNSSRDGWNHETGDSPVPPQTINKISWGWTG